MKKKETKTIATFTHKDKRANIPTEELRDFVSHDEHHPKTILYPRDSSLDPQLVWSGKDEQDKEPFEVPAVPIYIQEKVSPSAIIENIRNLARKGTLEQSNLFDDFNGIEFQDLIDFYQHEQNWTNRFILGDSLLAMTSLAEKEGLKGKVQMIYFDPPYGIKFGSNWQVSTRKRDVRDGKAEDATRQPEQVKAFRDTWELGVHSYLSYLRDRITVARDMLTESGSIFVQIGDENVHLVRCLMDEVYGSENFCQIIPFRKKLMPLGAKLMEGMCDYLLWYSKNISVVKYKHLYRSSEAKYASRWTNVEDSDGTRKKLSKQALDEVDNESRVYRLVSQRAPSYSETNVYCFKINGREYKPPQGGCWVSSENKMLRLAKANRLEVEGDNVSYIYYHQDFPFAKITNWWDDTSPVQDKDYVVQTSVGVIERCLLMTTDPGDLVLDPTCGSGTTAYVAEQWGRRWITMDTSRVAIALARTRLMSAKYPYYLLADSIEGKKKEQELSSVPDYASDESFNNDIRRGFVFKRVPHITLKSIANNEEIDIIHAKWQEVIHLKLEQLSVQIAGKITLRTLEEWEVPREADQKWSKKALEIHAEYWKLRRERQIEIDTSIARHADLESLYDQPYENSKRIRVTGPFTVESLSPHRFLAPADDNQDGKVSIEEKKRNQDFVSMIIDNLRKAGVQNTKKDERLRFDRLEPFGGTWLNATGEYTEKVTRQRGDVPSTVRRVAICIGPEHGTVGPSLVKEAAKEAVQGIGYDLLIVCGFAFDPHVSEEIKRYGNLAVLPARMNPDLSMGDELLKKTGAGNLFMVFGEPDIQPLDSKTGKLLPQSDGNYVIEMKGVDVYDPTTGQLRSNSVDDTACWFIDTNYNGESFFVRHAYFTGSDQPYEKLKKVLRADINESAWSALYKNVSLPFPPPATGKIAVKVINHYGDEVLKVFEIETAK